ncbi:hypothetical protein ACIPSA_49180 [Streptomyces sp. NPDC086549]|uniref:hypothetical protein n=1 Tax=Streptomyces sp. NPDC086549 TaxID=3365752 RepID=UPI00382AE82A
MAMIGGWVGGLRLARGLGGLGLTRSLGFVRGFTLCAGVGFVGGLVGGGAVDFGDSLSDFVGGLIYFLALSFGFGLVLGLAGGLTRTRTCGLGLMRSLGLAPGVALGIGCVFGSFGDIAAASSALGLFLALFHGLVRGFDGVRRGAARLFTALEVQGADPQPGDVLVRVAWCAGWLVGLAVRVVPVEEQARYGEEWRGELWDLAGDAGRRRHQTVHAMRTLMGAWPVRRSIGEGRRSTAGGS